MSTLDPSFIFAEIKKQVPTLPNMLLEEFIESLNKNKEYLSTQFLELSKIKERTVFYWEFFQPESAVAPANRWHTTEELEKHFKEICSILETIKNPQYVMQTHTGESFNYPGPTYYVSVVIIPSYVDPGIRAARMIMRRALMNTIPKQGKITRNKRIKKT